MTKSGFSWVSLWQSGFSWVSLWQRVDFHGFLYDSERARGTSTFSYLPWSKWNHPGVLAKRALNDLSHKLSQLGVSATTVVDLHKYTNTQTHKHTDTQTHRHTNTQIHKHTNTNLMRHCFHVGGGRRCSSVGRVSDQQSADTGLIPWGSKGFSSQSYHS